MIARFRKFLGNLAEIFWLVPASMVVFGVLAAIGLVALDRRGIVPTTRLDGSWLYNGGGTGARTLLGAVASSSIGVAGTVFTITIAALSLAAGQMGPRLLRNFTRDRGNQITLGAFLGTYSYSLMVLRSVRTETEGTFVPHVSMSVGILLAFVCVGTLVYFVGHMAGRINVDTVVDLVSQDVHSAIQRLTLTKPPPPLPSEEFWRDATSLVDLRRGYLQQLDPDGLADWAAENGASIRMLVRPDDYVFPGAPIAMIVGSTDGAGQAVRDATALGAQRSGSEDLEFSIHQLVEVAVRALSPGINDPYTAMSVLDRLGSALCEIAPLYLPTGVSLRGERAVLVVPSTNYDGLVDAAFHMIRQNAGGKPSILIRLLEVMAAIAACELDPSRVRVLRRHADLVLSDAQRSVANPDDFADVHRRYERFVDQTMRGRPTVDQPSAYEVPPNR